MNRNRTRQALRDRAGFTLIELMVVITIIAVLAAFVAPQFLTNVDQANQTAAKAQIKLFDTALMTYKLKFKKFPSSSEGLAGLNNNPSGIKYLQEDVPKDPWGNDYQYTSPGRNGNPYEIVSYGSDGAPGGTGFAADIESWNLQGT